MEQGKILVIREGIPLEQKVERGDKHSKNIKKLIFLNGLVVFFVVMYLSLFDANYFTFLF